MAHPYTRFFVLPSAPTINTDVSEGYEIGDIVIVTGGSIYDCRDATNGAAVWEERISGSYQPLDADLTAIAGLTPTDNDVLQRKSGAWTNRTIALLLVDMLEGIQDIVGDMITSTGFDINISYNDFDGNVELGINYSTLRTNLELVDDTEGQPAPIGTAADGTSYYFARRDHVHAGAYSSLTGTLTQTAGTYTPTLTNTTNIDASAVSGPFQYSRLGNIVTVAGNITIDPTAAANTLLGISLPIASNFTTTMDASGVGSAQISNTTGSIGSDATNDRATLTFQATSTANAGWRVMFMYEVK